MTSALPLFLPWCLCAALAIGTGCSAPEARSTVPYRNDFSGPLGPEWTRRGGGWKVVGGRLFNDGAHNVPLWLQAELPSEVRISFTAESRSDAVDIKCEVFGDGQDHASGYVVILSGWNNTKSIIARLNEHGRQRSEEEAERLRAEVRLDSGAAQSQYEDLRDIVARGHRGTPNRRYRIRLERSGHELRFYVDDELHLTYFDPSPLSGEGHDRFAFNNWASVVFFDDLVIEPLQGTDRGPSHPGG